MAIETVQVARFHCQLNKKQKEDARMTLREAIKANPRLEANDIHADCVLEDVWNAIIDAIDGAKADAA